MDTKENLYCTKNLELIIKYLKILNYDIEDWSLGNVKEFVCSPSTFRIELLFWTLNKFGLSYTSQEQRNFNQSVINKIVNDLAAIGICKLQDANLVNGSGNKASQIIFWRNLLDYAIRLTSKSRFDLKEKADAVIYNVVNSLHYGESVKVEELNLLSKDLQQQYRNSQKKPFDYRQRKIELEQKLQAERKVWESQPDCDDKYGKMADLIEEIPKVVNRCVTFGATHKSSLDPWCKGPLPPPDISRETDRVVAQCFEQLERFQKSASLSSNVEASHDRLRTKIGELKRGMTPPSVTLLDSIVNP